VIDQTLISDIETALAQIEFVARDLRLALQAENSPLSDGSKTTRFELLDAQAESASLKITIDALVNAA